MRILCYKISNSKLTHSFQLFQMDYPHNPEGEDTFRGFTDYPVYSAGETQIPTGYQPQNEQAFQVRIFFEKV